MPKIKLTKMSVDTLPAPDPSGKQTLYWDKDSAIARSPGRAFLYTHGSPVTTLSTRREPHKSRLTSEANKQPQVLRPRSERS